MTDDQTRLRDDVRRLELENAALRSALAASAALVPQQPGAAPSAIGGLPGGPAVPLARRRRGRRVALVLLALAAAPVIYYAHLFDLGFTTGYRGTACIAETPAPGERAPTTGRPDR